MIGRKKNQIRPLNKKELRSFMRKTNIPDKVKQSIFLRLEQKKLHNESLSENDKGIINTIINFFKN